MWWPMGKVRRTLDGNRFIRLHDVDGVGTAARRHVVAASPSAGYYACFAAGRVGDRGNPPDAVGTGLGEPDRGAVGADGDPRRAQVGGVRSVESDLAGAGVDAGDPGVLGEPQVAVWPVHDAFWPRGARW